MDTYPRQMTPNSLCDFLVFCCPKDCLYKIHKYINNPQPPALIKSVQEQKDKPAIFKTLIDRVYAVKCAKSGHKFHSTTEYIELYDLLVNFVLENKIENQKYLQKYCSQLAKSRSKNIKKLYIKIIWNNLTVEEINRFLFYYDEYIICDWYYQIPIHNKPLPYKWMYLLDSVLLHKYKIIADQHRPSDYSIKMIIDDM